MKELSSKKRGLLIVDEKRLEFKDEENWFEVVYRERNVPSQVLYQSWIENLILAGYEHPELLKDL